jgi:transcriptional regulator with XRE-family HTH domain
MICPMTAGLLIGEARKRAGLTQAELAHRLGSHQSVVARWETGRTNPDFATVQRAIRAAGFELGVSLHPFDDHDLALVRRELKLLPHERLSGMVEAVNQIETMSRTAHG